MYPSNFFSFLPLIRLEQKPLEGVSVVTTKLNTTKPVKLNNKENKKKLKTRALIQVQLHILRRLTERTNEFASALSLFRG